MADYILLENGDKILLEDGSGDVLNEEQGNTGSLTLPATQLSGSGVEAGWARLSDYPIIIVSNGGGSARLSGYPIVIIRFRDDATVSLPALQFSGTGVVTTGSSSVSLPTLQFSGVGDVPFAPVLATQSVAEIVASFFPDTRVTLSALEAATIRYATLRNCQSVLEIIAPYNTSKLTVMKVTDPSGEAQDFEISISGGNIPAEMFTLSDGQSRMFNGVFGVFNVTETLPNARWSVVYVVSNSDPHTAIDVGFGDQVTVIITNTHREAFCPEPVIADAPVPAEDFPGTGTASGMVSAVGSLGSGASVGMTPAESSLPTGTEINMTPTPE